MRRSVPLSARFAPLALFALMASCSSVPTNIEGNTSALTAAERRARAALIRDAAAARGLEEGWLLVGIAQAETGLAHCWSEATWACQGPDSVDCGGGPVIAGSADGPCSAMQGGLGMFQFDGGTFSETIARDGERVLTIDGSVEAAIEFVSDMVIRSQFVDGVSTRDQAVEWMNGVSINGSRWDAWVSTVVRYYNGCRMTSSCWSSRYASYRDKTIDVYDEFGADFWGDLPVTTMDAGTMMSDDGTMMSLDAGSSEALFVANYDGTTFASPLTLPPGGRWQGAVYFRNLGNVAWEPGVVELATLPAVDSLLADATWPRPSVAATVEHYTVPGDGASFIFTVQAPEFEGRYAQNFQLLVGGEPFGGVVQTVFSLDVQVSAGASVPDPVDPTMPVRSEPGCAAADPSGLGSLFGLLLFLRRRRH